MSVARLRQAHQASDTLPKDRIGPWTHMKGVRNREMSAIGLCLCGIHRMDVPEERLRGFRPPSQITPRKRDSAKTFYVGGGQLVLAVPGSHRTSRGEPVRTVYALRKAPPRSGPSDANPRGGKGVKVLFSPCSIAWYRSGLPGTLLGYEVKPLLHPLGP